MSVSQLMDRLDDAMNPIVVKELRQAVKSRMVVAVLMVFLGLNVLVLALFTLLVREARIGPEEIDWNAGNEIFRVLEYILLFTLMLLVPAYAAIRLGAERAEHNVDLLFISTLRPISIIAGKFCAALVLAVLVFSACAPFMVFTYLLRGIDLPTILVVLAIDVLMMLLATQFALFVAALPGPRGLKFFLAFLAFIALAVLYFQIMRGISEVIRSGIGLADEGWEVWAGLGVASLAVLCEVGLFFFWSVALISPPSSNRMAAVRIFVLIQVVLTGVPMFFWSYHSRGGGIHYPVTIWLIHSVALLCIQLWISVSERDRIGPRLARSVPRRAWLRPLAFLFTTGAAGGIILFSLLLIAVLTTSSWWHDRHDSMPGHLGLDMAVRSLTAAALFCFCYGLTAVLVRRHVLSNQLRPAFTWLIALLMVGIGSALPSTIAYIVLYDEMRYRTSEPGWWSLTNPFISVYEVAVAREQGYDYQTMLFWFLACWAALAALGCLPWLTGQMSRFHPPVPRVEEPTELPPAEALPLPAAAQSNGAGEVSHGVRL
jgi:hypothetical protein